GWRVTLGGIVRIGHGAGARAILGPPLVGACRALGQFPLMAKQVPQEIVAPLGWRRGPSDLDAAGDRIAALAAAMAREPAKALGFHGSRLWLRANARSGTSTMGLAEGVAAGDQRHRL